MFGDPPRTPGGRPGVVIMLDLAGAGVGGLSREESLALLVARDEAWAAGDARVDALLVQVDELTAQVQVRALALAKDSADSSKPPSSHRPSAASWFIAEGLGRKPGKQPGEAGTAVRLVAPGRSDRHPGPDGAGQPCEVGPTSPPPSRRPLPQPDQHVTWTDTNGGTGA